MKKTADELAQLRRQASRARAEMLLRINQNELTPTKAVIEACKPGNKALLRIRLRQLLIAIDGVGEKSAFRILSRVAAVAQCDEDPSKLTVQWLVDSRAGGRRWAAWLDAGENQQSMRDTQDFPWSRLGGKEASDAV